MNFHVRFFMLGCSRRRWAFLALLSVWRPAAIFPVSPGPVRGTSASRGKKSSRVLYQRNCAGCHGADGKLGPAPPLNDKLFLALIPDTELERLITEGRPGTLMPAFASAKGGQLTTEQVKILAEGIKPRWGPVEPAPSGAPPYLTPRTSSQGNVDRKQEEGLKVFARACASCHAAPGEGGRYGGSTDGSRWGRSTIRTSWP